MQPEETFFSEVLDSGVRVVGQPMAGVESAAVGVLIGAGARDEGSDRYGISHFTEQTLFRGTEHYDARQLSDRFDSLGISYDSSAGIEMSLVNAVLLGIRLDEALELLGEVIRFPTFPEDAVENVRSLLLQELRQREDQSAQKAFDLARQHFFAGSPLGNDVLGTEDTLKSIGREDLHRYWLDRYTKNNLVVSVAGRFDWDSVLSHLQSITASWPDGAGRSVADAPSPRPQVVTVQKELAQEHLAFAFPGVPVGDPDYYVASVFSQALGGSSNSRLFQEVREKRGLAYAVQSRFDGMQSTGLMRVYVGTSAERGHESVEVVLDELRNARLSPLTEDELRLSKTKLKSQLIMRSESTSARMMVNLRSWWFEERLRGLQEIKDCIDAVTVDDIQRLVDRLNITENLTAVAIGPRSERELFEPLLARS